MYYSFKTIEEFESTYYSKAARGAAEHAAELDYWAEEIGCDYAEVFDGYELT